MASAAPPGAFPAARHRRLWGWFCLAGLLGMVGYHFVSEGLAESALYQLFGLASAAAIVVGVAIHRPAQRRPWYLMAAGQLIWSIADAVGSWDADIAGNDRFPSPADPVYLIGYPVVAAGLLLLIRGRRPRRDVAGFLDSAILTVSLGILSWVLLARPTIAAFAQDSVAAAVVGAAYPVADIVLVALLIRLVTTPGGRTPSYRLLVAAVMLLVTVDTAASALNMLTFDSSDSIDFLWLASYTVWGAAALHPSMVSLSEPTVAASLHFSRKRLAALTLAALVAPVTLAVQALLGDRIDVWAIVVGSVTIFLLVMARMNLSIDQIQAANAEREAAQAELAHQAAHDSLTGLPNRAQAIRLIRGALGRAQRSGAVVGLLFVDLDGFKLVNDTLGHGAGDAVLRTAAERMQQAVRSGDVVARLGGDEFVVLLEPLDEQASAVAVGDRLVATLSGPVRVPGGRLVSIGASVGVALSQDGNLDPDRLLHEADLAVYRAKAAGRGRTEVYERSLRDELDRRSALQDGLRAAVAADELVVRYQPLIEVATSRMVGGEAQVSCSLPGREPVSRAELLATAGRTDLVCELDAAVLRRAAGFAHDAAEWLVAVPLTAGHLARPRVLADVSAALASGLPARRLMIIVDGPEVADDPAALAHLDELRRSGSRICLDGFGTGAGPTDRWARLPLDSVRLDRRVLDRTSPTWPALLRLTVDTAHAFGCTVIASGVARPQQLEVLAGVGCDLAQGPLFDRPGTVAAVTAPTTGVPSQRATEDAGTGSDQR